MQTIGIHHRIPKLRNTLLHPQGRKGPNLPLLHLNPSAVAQRWLDEDFITATSARLLLSCCSFLEPDFRLNETSITVTCTIICWCLPNLQHLNQRSSKLTWIVTAEEFPPIELSSVRVWWAWSLHSTPGSIPPEGSYERKTQEPERVPFRHIGFGARPPKNTSLHCSPNEGDLIQRNK